MYAKNLQRDNGIREFPKCFCLQNLAFEVHVTNGTFWEMLPRRHLYCDTKQGVVKWIQKENKKRERLCQSLKAQLLTFTSLLILRIP